MATTWNLWKNAGMRVGDVGVSESLIRSLSESRILENLSLFDNNGLN